jgi:hypothetical protein
VLSEHKVVRGDNEGMIEASFLAYRTGEIVPVRFVTDVKVFSDEVNCLSTGKNGGLEYWFKGFVAAVEWVPKDKVSLFCQGFREGREYTCPPFFLENYNYRAGKGRVLMLERVKAGDVDSPVAEVAHGTHALMSFPVDIEVGKNLTGLRRVLLQNGFRILRSGEVGTGSVIQGLKHQSGHFKGALSLGSYDSLPIETDTGYSSHPIQEQPTLIKAGTPIHVEKL